MQTPAPPSCVSNDQHNHCPLVCFPPPLLASSHPNSSLPRCTFKLFFFVSVLASSHLFLSSADGQPALLPPEQVQQLNVRSTGMLNNVQRLFSHHMIQTFGCDYSTSGVTLEALQAKLRNFLDLCTEDGPRHDTYLIFYSGHTHKGTGSWALAGKRPTYFARAT